MKLIENKITNAVIRILAGFLLLVWAVDFLGGTAWLFWCSTALFKSGAINHEFTLFAWLNILVCLMALPAVGWCWRAIDLTADDDNDNVNDNIIQDI